MLVNCSLSMNRLNFQFLSKKAFINLDQMRSLSFFEYRRGIIKILLAFIVADRVIIFEILPVTLSLSLGLHSIKLMILLSLMNLFLMKLFGLMLVVFSDALINTILAYWPSLWYSFEIFYDLKMAPNYLIINLCKY